MAVRILIAAPTDSSWLVTQASTRARRDGIHRNGRTGVSRAVARRCPGRAGSRPSSVLGRRDGVLALLNDEPALRPRVVMILAQGRNRSALYRLSRFKVDDYQPSP